MPYEIVSKHPGCPSSKPFAVVKQGTTKRMGCHSSRDGAKSQLAALYAAESSDKGSDDVHTKAPIKREGGIDRPARDYAYVPNPNLPTTWRLPMTDAPGRVSLQRLNEAAAALSPGGLHGVKVNIPASALSAVKRRILSEYRMLKVPEGKIPMSVKEKHDNGFTIWKDARTGQYRWMALYSNNFLDKDREIISEKSHRTFVQLVDGGIVDFPELWHWHEPGTAWGKADMVDYFDGFALATGHVYPGHEKEAQALVGREDLGVSHGMPLETLLYDPNNPGVIDFHVTTEISVLPHHAVANPLTDFVVLENLEEQAMSMTSNKRDWLINEIGLSEDFVKSLERQVKDRGKNAQGAGIASKESEAEVEVEETDVEEENDLENAEAEKSDKAMTGRRPRDRDKPMMDEDEEEDDKPAKKELEYATKEEVASVFSEVLTPIMESLAETQAQLAEMSQLVKELTTSDAERLGRVKEQTPTLSLASLVRDHIAIGQDAAKLDGRTQLAKEGPVEAKSDTQMYTPSSFVNGLMSTAMSGPSKQAQE